MTTETRSTYHEHPILPCTGRERLRRSSPNSSLAEMQSDINRVRRYQFMGLDGGRTDNHNAGSAPKLTYGAPHPVCEAIRRKDIDFILFDTTLFLPGVKVSLGMEKIQKQYAEFCTRLGRKDLGNRRLVRRFLKTLLRKR